MWTIGDFLTEPQIKATVKIWETDRKNFHKRVHDEIVVPNIGMINRRLGQNNDARYLAYALEYVLTEADRTK